MSKLHNLCKIQNKQSKQNKYSITQDAIKNPFRRLFISTARLVLPLLLSTSMAIADSTIADSIVDNACENKNIKEKILFSQKYNHGLNDIETITKRVMACDDLHIDRLSELDMIDELQKFDLGKYLLNNGRLNGYWLSYIVNEAPNKDLDNPLESWIVNEAPVFKATKERSKIFQTQMSKYIRANSMVASMPCGTMDDLNALNLEGIYDVKFVGIDRDEEVLKLAKLRANPSRYYSIDFKKQDDLELNDTNKYNVVVSNGLNIYEPDNDKVVGIYSKFHKALIPGGVLITSFLTPAPEVSKKSTWRNYNHQDYIKQKALLTDIIQAKWQTFRTEDETRQQLQKAGFNVVDVIYDSQGMFPTVVAKKQN